MLTGSWLHTRERPYALLLHHDHVKPLQGRCLHPLPGQLILVSNHSFHEEILKPSLKQVEVISSCSITCYLGEKAKPPGDNLLSDSCRE